MRGLDEWITRFDDREPEEEDEYAIDGYEAFGTFYTEEDAIEHALNNTLLPKLYITDYIYKIKGGTD